MSTLRRETPSSDGVHLVELAPLTDASAIAATVAAAVVGEHSDVLGVVASGGPRPDADTRLREQLRTRRLLLVLDNCEHLLPAIAKWTDGALTPLRCLRLPGRA